MGREWGSGVDLEALFKERHRHNGLNGLLLELKYSPEELVGMMLNYSRSLAQEFAEQPIKDLVITVPVYFNQAERRAVLQAAHIAGLKVLQLINDNTAVALNYGVFRRKDINSTAQTVMFYDMGSSSTTATIIIYQTVKTKDSGTQPQLHVRGVGYDRTLGGFEMELRLRDHLATLFNGQKKSSKDVREHPRAMGKLWKEANRVKTILSANVDHVAQIEGLLDDIDFRAKVTRAEFEDLCGDLFERVAGPVHQALKVAEMHMDEIDQVILVGGATRVPKVQEILLKVVGKEELGKNINADEAAAMGAVYQAAALSKAFKVKPFLIRDAALYPIQVEFMRDIEEEEGVKSIKHNKRVLFQRMSPYPQRKVITFNRYIDDFEFFVNYGEMNFLDDHNLGIFGSLNLTTVRLNGVGSSFKKHTDAESKGIKAHFNMDESGILTLDRVESVFEKLQDGEPEEESTLTKLGNTISSLFGGGSSEPDAKENLTESVHVSAHSVNCVLGLSDEDEVPSESGRSEQEEQPTQPKDDPAPSSEEEAQSEGEKLEPAAEGENPDQASEGEKPQPVDPDQASQETPDTQVSNLSVCETPKWQLLQDLSDRDFEKQEREKVANTLEAFIFETQDKLHQDEYQAVSAQDGRDQISAKLSEVSTWLEEEGYTANTKELKAKLLELRKLCKDLFFKVDERRKWPDRLAALDSMLNHSSIFLRGARMIPGDDQIFTEVELNMLENVINETIVWKNTTIAEQNKLSPTVKPILLSKDIEAKLSVLDREVKYLLNKAKFAKPKPKKEKVPKNTTQADKSTANANQEKVIPPPQEKPDKEIVTEAGDTGENMGEGELLWSEIVEINMETRGL
uniref:Hypoxia up-regulated protein 1 n=1 Tax=Callorhinchus milii TaxID=7868 RepID=A0A4W3J9L5_CALMI